MEKLLINKKILVLSFSILILVSLLRILLPIVFKEEGTITEILERCEGVEYENVSIGSECPCKIIVEYKDKAEADTTFGEVSPCGSFMGNYYEVGDLINFRPSIISIIGMINYVLIVIFVITSILFLLQRRKSLPKIKHKNSS